MYGLAGCNTLGVEDAQNSSYKHVVVLPSSNVSKITELLDWTGPISLPPVANYRNAYQVGFECLCLDTSDLGSSVLA